MPGQCWLPGGAPGLNPVSMQACASRLAQPSCLRFYPPEMDGAQPQTWQSRLQAIRSHYMPLVDLPPVQYCPAPEPCTLSCHIPEMITDLQAYANDRAVKIVGDMPIYVGGQSADVWAHQELFELTETSAPAMVSGVPPDAFSETGQLWGSPLYDWKVGQGSC